MIRPKVNFFWSDVPLVILFAIIGYAGYSSFPRYQRLSEQVADIHWLWLPVFVSFNILLLFRKFRTGYIYLTDAFSAVALLHLFISLVIYILFAGIVSWELASGIVGLSAQQAGISAVYLMALSWIVIEPDMSSLRVALIDFDRRMSDLSFRNSLTRADVESGLASCERVLSNAETLSKSHPSLPAAIGSIVNDAIARASEKKTILESPMNVISKKLRGFD